MTSPKALAAGREICELVNATDSLWLADIIDRHFAPLRAERDALALRCAAMEKEMLAAADACDHKGPTIEFGLDSWPLGSEVAYRLRAALSQPAQVQT